MAGLGRLWARSAGFALAFAVFASTLLWTAPVWSQSMLSPVLTFVATTATTTEGGDGVELQIGLPQGHVGRSVAIDLSLGGTALLGTDYTLVAGETSGSVSIDETTSGVTLRLIDVPDTPLILLLRPRANDVIRQGDRRAELRLSGYRVAGVERNADVLPTALGVTILDRYLPVRQRLLGVASGAACVLLDEQDDDLVQLRCWTVADAAVELRTVLASTDILTARQLAFGEQHVCWLQQDRQVVCEGSNSSEQLDIPSEPSTTVFVSVAAGRVGSCAVDEDGAVHCWGRNGDEQSALPADLRPVIQLSLGDGHGCALHEDGSVSCWGDNAGNAGDKATPPDDLGPVLQLALGYEHSCALQRDGQLRCWGANMPPDDLGPATQLTSGASHSCALLADGEVRCWGANDSGQLSVPSLPPGGVKSLVAGGNSSCALLAEGSVRCWGGGLESAVPAELRAGVLAVSVLPQRLPVGQRAAIRFADLRGEREAPAVRIELLDGTARFGSDYRLLDAAGQPVSAAPDGRYLLAGDRQPAAYIESLPDAQGRLLRTLYVLPLETVPADGAAPSLRRAAQPVELTAATDALARLRVSVPAGNVLQLPAQGTDTITVDVRVEALDTMDLPIAVVGLLLVAERIAGSAHYWSPSVAMPAALSATDETGVLEGQLRVALDEDDTSVELRIGVIGFAEAQEIIVDTAVVRVLRALSFIAAALTTTEGADGVELQIRVPQEHVGSRVDMVLTGSGTAVLGVDYFLSAADPAQGIVLGDETTVRITLRVESAPAELSLLLRPRADDHIAQGDRFLNLRISSYRVVPEGGGTVDLPPALDFTIRDDEPPTVRQLLVGRSGLFACVLLNSGSVRCWGSDEHGQSTPPGDLGQVAQLAVGLVHSCAVTVSGRVRCWGSDEDGQSTPPEDLAPVAQLVLHFRRSCAVTVSGEVRCWGDNRYGQSSPPHDLGPVVQLAVGDSHSCAVTVSGRVRCWGSDVSSLYGNPINPPEDLGPFVQLAVGQRHNCVVTVSGRVRCWGSGVYGQASPAYPPNGLGAVVQLGVGDSYSCALTIGDQVRCWGSDKYGQSTPPGDLGPVAQLAVGEYHSCALTVSGEVRCWGYYVANYSSLPPGSITAIDASGGSCALLADGSVYCPGGQQLVPPELRSDVVMSVWPRQLQPGQRAAIRFADLRGTTAAFTARIEVFGEGEADVGSYYRLLDSSGQPLSAEPDANSALVAANSVIPTGNPPMAWLEALADGRSSRLYVRPLELLSVSGPAPSIRKVMQLVELSTGPFLIASTDTLAEGAEEAQLSIWLPLAHSGLRVEMELAASGTALAGSDYTLVAADSEQGIVLGGEATDEITLRVESAPTEPLRLLLRPRADDRIGQGDRFLNLRISSYRVVPEGGGTVDLPPALDFTIRDDEPPTVRQLLGGRNFHFPFACFHLNGGSVRCWGQSTPPADLGAVAQLGVGDRHSCAVTVLGRVRCWGSDEDGRSTPPGDDLGPFVQLAVGYDHSCALTVGGQVRCWGSNYDPFGLHFPENRAFAGQARPPDDLGAVVQVAVGRSHSCAVMVGGQVRCWGSDEYGRSTPPEDLGAVAQLGVGDRHSCALTVFGEVRCWGGGDLSSPPNDLGPVAQIGVGYDHSCALTVGGQVRCWGSNGNGRSTPPDNLGPVAQIGVGVYHSCALTVSGRMVCWGNVVDISSLPAGMVTAVSKPWWFRCALLAEGSVYCPDNPELVPPWLGAGDVAMSVWPRQLQPGQRAAIHFADLRETTGAFTARIEVFGDGSADVGSYYRLLDRNGQPLSAEPDGSYRLEGNPLPMAWLESSVGGHGQQLNLYVRPLELLPVSGPAPSIRLVAQPVELIAASTATVTLVRLRVSVPAGNVLQLPAQGTDTITVDVRVEALDIRGRPIALAGLLLVAERVAGSARYWLPSVDMPAALSATGETGVFEGQLRVALDEDDTSVELRIAVIGFAQAQAVIVETAVVRVLQALSFIAAASTVTEGADGVELQIGLPQGHVGRSVEIDLNIAGTALLGTDYTLVAGETSGSVSIDETTSGVTLRLIDVPDTPLILLLRPRANDVIRQGDRRAELRLSGYRVAGVERNAEVLPTALGVTILDRYLPVRQRLLDVASGAACVLLDEDNEDLVELRCWTVADAAAELRTVLDADDILSARQLSFGEQHVCWLQQDRQLVCDGSNSSEQLDIPSEPSTTVFVSVAAGRVGSCAVDEDGAVHCWGRNGDEQSALPADLRPVIQLSIGDGHGCALHEGGSVSCWGDNAGNAGDKATPPDDLDPVLQLALGYEHSCALQRDGQLRCWGAHMPPDDLGPAMQLTSGASHSCALLADGEVSCWGANDSGQLSVPSLPPGGVKSLVAGGNSSCALLAEGSVRCWGGGLESTVPAELRVDDVAVSVLPQRLPVGQRAAIRFADLRGEREAPAVRIELLDGTARFGSDYRLLDAAGQPVSAAPDGRYLLAGDRQPAAYIESLPDAQGRLLRTLYVLPLETVPADGAAPSLRRAAQPVELTAATDALARLRVSVPAGNVLQLPAQGTDTFTVDVRVEALDTMDLPIAVAGLLLVAERIAGSAHYWSPSVAMPAALSATDETGVLEGQLRVALDEDDTSVELRIGVIGFAEAQEVIVDTAVVRVLRALSFIAAALTTTEGADGVELQIRVPQEHVGSRVDMVLTGSGTAVLGVDYFLSAADPAQGIVLGDETTVRITLRVESAPAELSLLLRPRADDHIAQGDRFLNLRISSYRVVPEGGGTVDLPPALDFTIRDDEPPTVRQLLVGRSDLFACVLFIGRCTLAAGTAGGSDDFACVLLNSGSVRCWGSDEHGQSTPPGDLGQVAQLAVGLVHSCAVTVSGRVRCWGSDEDGQSTPPEDLAPVAQLVLSFRRSCAVTVSGEVRCWGDNRYGQSSPPHDLGPVVQLAVGDSHSCAVTVSGRVRCWGGNFYGQSLPPHDLGRVVQLAVGEYHSCAVTVSGRVRCWGSGVYGQASPAYPPNGLGAVVQLAVGNSHSCALTIGDQVRCWGSNEYDQSTPPGDLGPVAQLAVGLLHSCALTVSGEVRCWGYDVANYSSLPPGSITAIDASGGSCALLADGSVYCSGGPQLVPPELRSDVVMSVWPRQLQPGQRAAIRFADLRETTAAFTARIEVFGDGSADVGSYYRLLDSSGQPLSAEPDANSALVAANSVIPTGNPPMAWLEALAPGRSSRLYVRPLELLSASGPAPSIRKVMQLVELSTGPFLIASTDTLAEGAEEAQLSIWLPLAHSGLRVEMELAVSGTALAGLDYTLVVADSEQGIVLGGEATDEITLRVESAPTEPLRLLLRPRADDRIGQGDRFLNLRISSYRVVSEGGGIVDLPPALDFTISDDEPPTVRQLLVGRNFHLPFACVHLNGGSVRCWGDNRYGQSTPPDDLGPVAQLGVGDSHSCALNISGQVRCWGQVRDFKNGSSVYVPPTPPGDDLGPFVQLAVGRNHSCALTVGGQVRCWGSNYDPSGIHLFQTLGSFPGQARPPDDLGAVVQVAAGRTHSCAVMVGGQVRCWGSDEYGRSTPPEDLGAVAQLGVGDRHSCALTVFGEVRCWGSDSSGQSTPPDNLGMVAQLGVGEYHSCALTVGGEVRCWGSDSSGQSTPPDNLGMVAQLDVGGSRSCALTVSGRMVCWGTVIDISSLPAGMVTAVSKPWWGRCALLAEGSVYCPDNPELVPPGLGAGDVAMSVWPRQLQPGQRAAIHFADLRETTGAFTARIEVFGDGSADVGSYYRLLDRNGQPLSAEPDGSYLLEGGSPNSPQLTGNSLEALADGRSSRLYVRPLGLQTADGSELSMRKVAQPVEFVNPEPFVGKLILQMHGGAKQLLLPTDVALIPLRLSLTDSDDSPLSEFFVLTVQLQGMATGDGAVVPDGPFEITASSIVAGTAEVHVILGNSGETTLHFSVLGLPSGATVELLPEVLRVTRPTTAPVLYIDEDERVGTEDIILLMKFMTGGRDEPPRQGVALQARLESLMQADVVDLRLDLDGDGRIETADFRIILRHLAGLRGSALGEGVRQEDVEALFQANR